MLERKADAWPQTRGHGFNRTIRRAIELDYPLQAREYPNQALGFSRRKTGST
jgi:hypothetical protein